MSGFCNSNDLWELILYLEWHQVVPHGDIFLIKEEDNQGLFGELLEEVYGAEKKCEQVLLIHSAFDRHYGNSSCAFRECEDHKIPWNFICSVLTVSKDIGIPKEDWMRSIEGAPDESLQEVTFSARELLEIINRTNWQWNSSENHYQYRNRVHRVALYHMITQMGDSHKKRGVAGLIDVKIWGPSWSILQDIIEFAIEQMDIQAQGLANAINDEGGFTGAYRQSRYCFFEARDLAELVMSIAPREILHRDIWEYVAALMIMAFDTREHCLSKVAFSAYSELSLDRKHMANWKHIYRVLRWASDRGLGHFDMAREVYSRMQRVCLGPGIRVKIDNK